MDVEFKAASRMQQSLLAPLERRCLNWLAGRIPQSVTPDHLTLLGLIAMLLAGVFYATARFWPLSLMLVNLCLAINWFGDSLDGTLARVRNKQRPRYGFYVDHIVDAFSSLFVIGGLALSGYITPMIGFGALIAFSLLSINAYLATYTLGTFKLSFWKFSPTELRLLLVIGNTFIWFRPQVGLFGHTFLLFDVGATIAIIGMAMMLVVSVLQNTITLYRAERV